MADLKPVWWREYRRQQYRPNVRNMSTEDIIRNVLSKTTREYITNCSLSGVWKMCEPTIGVKQRLVWILIFGTMIGGIAYFLKYLWIDNLGKPLIVTMDTSIYPIEEIDFPAVAVCNVNRISKKALKNYVKQNFLSLAKNKETVEEVERFFLHLGRLLNYTYDRKIQNNPLLTSLANHLGDSNKIIELMQQLAPSCEEMLMRCSWAGAVVDCGSMFTVHRTFHGHCCTFNYVLQYHSAESPNETIAPVKSIDTPGPLFGLNVILDPLIEDYVYSSSHMKGFEILVFDPKNFADPTGGRVLISVIQPDERMTVGLHSVKQIATSEVRKYPLLTRKCLFHDESKDRFINMYSYSACIVTCRIRTVQTLCRCTPYYLPIPFGDGRICTLAELKCLNKYKEKLHQLCPLNVENLQGLESELQDALYCPDCLPDCEHTQHSMTHTKIPLDVSKHIFRTDIVSGVNLSHKCWLTIYQTSPYGVLNRLDIVYYWFEILSNVGGFCGILIGFSIISLIEIIYFFFIRLFINLYQLYFGENNFTQ